MLSLARIAYLTGNAEKSLKENTWFQSFFMLTTVQP